MIITISLFYMIVLGYFVYFFYKERITPVTIFIISQCLFFSGLIKYLDFESEYDIKIALIYLVANAFFGMGAWLGRGIHPVRRRSVIFSKNNLTVYQKRIFSLLVLISLFWFAFFCYKTNFSTLNIIFENIVHSRGVDITNTRLASYSVPGTAFIYLFRITILPTIVVIILKSKGYSIPWKMLLCLFMVLFTLITGQRGGFVYVMLMWLLSYMIPLFYQNNKKLTKEAKKKAMLILGTLICVFFFLSTINGRVSGSLFGAVFQRFFDDNQITAYYAFHYIFDTGTCWGRNYYEEFVNLLVPGDKYLPLSKVVAGIMYGTTSRGTTPPCIWGSIFYNFSWFGIMMGAFLFGMLAQYIGYRLYSREVTPARCVVYSYMFIDLGMLVAGSPFHLFNNGFVPMLALAYILHIDRQVNVP